MSKSTLIIGSGIIGLCTAYYLTKRGHRVTIVDRDSLADDAMHPMPASKGNAGIIALGHPPLPRPGLVWQTIKWMIDGGSPLYVPPRLDLGLIAWMWQFRKACTPAHFQRCMKILADLGWATGRCWDQIIEQEKFDCEYRRTGWLDVYRTTEGMKHGELEANLLREYDFDVQMMSSDDLRRCVPGGDAFKKEVIGAAHYTDSRAISPVKFNVQMIQRLREMGVEFHDQCEISNLKSWMGNRTITAVSQDSRHSNDSHTFTADTLVLAAGVWTSQLAKQIGAKVPMQAGKGYHVMLTCPQPCPQISCVLNETYIAVTPMDGGLRLAGTVELSGINHRMMQKRVDMLTAGARNYLEGLEQAKITSQWCGLRPCTADGLPVIDWAKHTGGKKDVLIATGHAKYGLAYGPITGRLASECILDGKLSMDISALRADRF